MVDGASALLSSQMNTGNSRTSLQPRSDSYRSSSSIPGPPAPSRRISVSNDNYPRSHTTSIDTRLNEWLIRANIDVTSRTIIFNEDFSYEDFVYDLDKNDLHRIGLK